MLVGCSDEKRYKGHTWSIRCANLCSFAVVAVIPLPISAARRANSERFGFEPGPPSFSSFWAGVRRACLCEPFVE